MVSGQQHCTTTTDCTNILLCKIWETEQCVDNQCKCAPKPEGSSMPCWKTRDCDATMCGVGYYNKCVDGFCTCTHYIS